MKMFPNDAVSVTTGSEQYFKSGKTKNMKLLIITCLKEYKQDVADILGKAKVKVFSVSNTTGFKDDHTENLADSWFAAREESFDSLFIFSFTTAENAQGAMALIKNYNAGTSTAYPVRAFIVPVEQSSY